MNTGMSPLGPGFLHTIKHSIAHFSKAVYAEDSGLAFEIERDSSGKWTKIGSPII
jgi:hypothetical protein